MPPESDILSRLGISSKTLDRVRLARGVVGNTTYAIVAAFLAIAAVAWTFRDQPLIALGFICIVAFLALVYLIGTWIFAHKHPDVALLGGAELLKWRQMEMAAKGMPLLPEAPNVEPTPLIDSPEEE